MVANIKEFDKNLFDLIKINTYVNIHYLDFRIKNKIDKLEDDDYITLKELSYYLGVTRARLGYLLYSNRKYCKRDMYNVLLESFVEKHKFKKLANKIFIKKENIKHFQDYKAWLDEINEIRKNKAEYKKALLKYYGNPSQATKWCIEANYDCSQCVNREVCDMFKTNISQKSISKLINTVFYDKSGGECLYESRVSYERQLSKLKKELKKQEKETKQYFNCYKQTKQELYQVKQELSQYKKAFAKIHAEAFNILELIAEGYTLSEIADMMNCSEQNVRQIKIRFLNQINSLIRLK